MSRKQYRDMAAVIQAERNVGHNDGLPTEIIIGIDLATRNIASGLATVFEIDNPRFDRDRFMEACGIE
jgi:transposase